MSVLTSFMEKKLPYQGEIMIGEHRVICGFVSNHFGERKIHVYQRSKPLTEEQAIIRMILMVKRYQEMSQKEPCAR